MVLDPSKAKQKFYSSPLTKGCSIVAFYNHRKHRLFTDKQIEHLKQLAVELFGDIPWQSYGPVEKLSPLQLFVIVEIDDHEVVVSLALLGDQARIGHQDWKRQNGYVPGVVTIRKALRECARGWRARQDLSDCPPFEDDSLDEE